MGEVGDLRLGKRLRHFRHDAVITAPRVGFVFHQSPLEIVFALTGDARNVVAAGQIQSMTTVAAVRGNQRSTLRYASLIAGIR